MSEVKFKDFEYRNNSSSHKKEKRGLMATDIIRELRKLVKENVDKQVFVSTGSECCDAREVSTYKEV